jgi:hypothetical protein
MLALYDLDPPRTQSSVRQRPVDGDPVQEPSRRSCCDTPMLLTHSEADGYYRRSGLSPHDWLLLASSFRLTMVCPFSPC